MITPFIFIDARVPDIDTLLAAFPREAEVVLLNPAQDGVQQIAAVLAGQSDIDAIHIVSHGAEGTLFLGDAVLNSSTLAQYRTELQIIGAALNQDGDILLYGCDVAGGPSGKTFIEQLAAYTRADVAASTNVTGSFRLGGDWLLEANAGSVEAKTLIASGFTGTLAATLPSGALDPTFDGDGKVTTSFGTGDDVINAMVIQPDGKILVAGTTSIGGNRHFALARYNTDGSLDTTFYGDGKLFTVLGSGEDVVTALALQTDGRILAGGYATVDSSQRGAFALARYNADGSLDTTFDGDGRVIASLASNASGAISALAVTNDGSVVVSGGQNSGAVLARFTADGMLDGTFDGDGWRALTPSGNGGSGFSNASDLFVQPDGKLVVAITSYFSLLVVTFGFSLRRYDADGTNDTTFVMGDPGIPSSNNLLGTTIVQPDGKIVAAFSVEEAAPTGFPFFLFQTLPYPYATVLRFNTDGSRDLTFANSPILVLTDFKPSDAALQTDGKIVVVGQYRTYDAAHLGSGFRRHPWP